MRNSAARILGINLAKDTYGAASANSVLYADDDLDHVVMTNAGGLLYGYNYDASGNRTSRQMGSVRETTDIQSTSNCISAVRMAGSPVLAALPARAYGYDPMGNVLSDGSITQTYDDLGHVTSVTTRAGTYPYQNNAAGQRVRKSAPLAGIKILIDTFYLYDTLGRLSSHRAISGQGYGWSDLLDIARRIARGE